MAQTFLGFGWLTLCEVSGFRVCQEGSLFSTFSTNGFRHLFSKCVWLCTRQDGKLVILRTMAQKFLHGGQEYGPENAEKCMKLIREHNEHFGLASDYLFEKIGAEKPEEQPMKRLRLAPSELDEKSIKELPNVACLALSATLDLLSADEGKKLYMIASEKTQLLRHRSMFLDRNFGFQTRVCWLPPVSLSLAQVRIRQWRMEMGS